MANSINPRAAERQRAGFNPTVDNTERKAEASGGAKAVLFASFILLFPIIWYVVKRNALNKLQQSINESAAGIDVQLQKRRDTLVKMYDAAKGYLKHEKDIHTMVAKVRSTNVHAGNRSEVNGQLNSAFSRLLATFEAYPDLKGNQVVNKLMDESAYIEREIGASRRLYNSYVTKFNQTLVQFPSSVVATGMNLVSFPLFQATVEATRDVKFDFNS